MFVGFDGGVLSFFLYVSLTLVIGRFMLYVLVFIDSEFVENSRFNIYSERVWRLVVGMFLLIGYSFYSVLWFLPWFMGFAIFGAGLSGLCPVLLAIHWIGFK